MKKIFFLVFAMCTFASSLFAEDDPFASVHKSLKDQSFVVETDDASGTESLNRIAGDIDLGFTTPDQEYHSESHGRSGPFSYEKEQDTRQTY